jgi:hypothetical protein
MRTVIRGIVRTQLLMFVTAVVGMADPVHKVGLTGRFIAYRPSDRLAQTASFVANKEAFLLQAEDSKHKSVVKVEYEYVGYSDITEEMLEKAPLLNLKVRRNPSCDQSYSQFISTAPTIRDEQSGKDSVPMLPPPSASHRKRAKA